MYKSYHYALSRMRECDDFIRAWEGVVISTIDMRVAPHTNSSLVGMYSRYSSYSSSTQERPSMSVKSNWAVPIFIYITLLSFFLSFYS